MKLFEETRAIKSITVGTGDECNYYEVGRLNAWMKRTPTKIIAESVNGEMAEITWFAVYEGEDILVRANQSFVSEIAYI